MVGAEIAGAHNNDWRQRKQIARMLFRGDLLISVTVQGILMSANAQAKGLLAELMQCHPALVVCGHSRYYNCRHSDCKADRGAGTDATKSFVNAIKPHLGSEYRLAILCGSHHCYFSLASGAEGWVRNSVAAEASITILLQDGIWFQGASLKHTNRSVCVVMVCSRFQFPISLFAD